MANEAAQALIDQLDDLLDKERAILLSGDLASMAGLADEKERLFDALNALEPDEEASLGELQSKVVRNQALLDGALQGIRKVAARLAALRKIRRTLETYDAMGRKQTIQSDIEHRVERRA